MSIGTPSFSSSSWKPLVAALVVVLMLVGCSWLTARRPAADERADGTLVLRPGVMHLVVEAPNAGGASIAWDSAWNGRSTVFYGEHPRVMPHASARSAPTWGRQVGLSGLKPDTRYFFQVETVTPLGVARSAVCSFRTRR